jgi:hypothetical protein
MVFVYVAVVFASSSADLEPPFAVDSSGKIGSWVLGGSALRQDDVIMLAPPIQFSRGSAWTSVIIPGSDWSIEYNFRIHEGSSGGSLGFWVVDTYGSDGDLFGGSSIFQGIAVLLFVRRADHTSRSSIGLTVLQHATKTKAETDAVAQHTRVIPYRKLFPIHLLMEISDGDFIVKIQGDGNDRMHEVYREKLIVNISNNYIGITAQSGALTSRFDLFSVKLKVPEPEKERDVHFPEDGPKSHFHPQTSTILRSPFFVKTLELISRQSQNSGEFSHNVTDPVEILEIADELTHVSHHVTSLKELNAFMSESIIPYTQKWHRRTVKIVDRVTAARNVMGSAWNYTHEMLGALNRTFYSSAKKTRFQVTDLGDLFTAESEKLEGDADRLGRSTRSLAFLRIFIAIALVELFLILIFFCLLQSQSIRIRISAMV